MKTEIEITLTPDQLAEMFIHWFSDEQAAFFNLVGKHFKQSDFDSEGQCCSATRDINRDGKDFIYTMANFIQAKNFSYKNPHFNMLINKYPCDGLYKEEEPPPTEEIPQFKGTQTALDNLSIRPEEE